MPNKTINALGAYDISSEIYHADPCPVPSLSRSAIKQLLYDTPYHCWLNHPRLNPGYKENDGGGKFDLGTAAHQLLLEGGDSIAVIEYDDYRKGAAKQERDEAREQGLTPLLRKQYDEAIKMVAVAEKQISQCKELKITDFRKDGDTELSYIWQEEEAWCRVRPDWISKDRKIIIDYKTTGMSANPESINKHVVSMGYDIQAGFYTRGVDAVEKSKPVFILVFQETNEPYMCSFVGLDPEFLEMGKQKADYGLFLWNKCMKSGEWPGYPTERIAYIDAPSWSLVHWNQIAENIGEGE